MTLYDLKDFLLEHFIGKLTCNVAFKHRTSFYAPAPAEADYVLSFECIYKKDVGAIPLLVPLFQVFALPSSYGQATRTPTPNMIVYKLIIPSVAFNHCFV